MSGLVANFSPALSAPLIHCSGHCLLHVLMEKGSACRMIKVLIVLQPEADSGKVSLSCGITSFTEVDVHVVHIITGRVFWSCYKYAQFGSGFKKKTSGLSDLLK